MKERSIAYCRTIHEVIISKEMENVQFHLMAVPGGTWYPQACKFLKLKHHYIHLRYEKSIVERKNTSLIIAFNPTRHFSYSSGNLSSMYLLILSLACCLKKYTSLLIMDKSTCNVLAISD
jgi:hypothetical protein